MCTCDCCKGCDKGHVEDKLIHDHLFEHFKLHAEQRVQLFRFYTVFLTLAIAGMGFLLLQFNSRTPYFEVAGTALGLLLFGVAIVFKKIDKRNTELIDHSREALIKFESKNFPCQPEEYKVFNQDKKPSPIMTHTQCYNMIYYSSVVVAVIFILLVAYFSRIVFACC